MDEELLRQRLYRIFRIEDENYMYTMKVMYIYRWVEKRHGSEALNIIESLRSDYKKRRNVERLDLMFRHMQAVNMQHLAAPPNARPPQSNDKYSPGWKLG